MKSFLMFFLLVVSFLISGCMTTRTDGVVVEDGTVVVHNVRFASHFVMKHQIKRGTDAGNFTQVQVAVRNDDTVDFSFQYRFTWFDKDGLEIQETAPVWHPASVYGKGEVTLEGVSENKEAVSFRLVIRKI